MIVADASALLELLLRTPRAGRLEELLLTGSTRIHVPELLDIEILQALRRLCLLKQITSGTALAVQEDLSLLGLQRHRHAVLLPRVWQLRYRLTAYDATYVALAEALGASLVTCDRRLARAQGHGPDIRVVE